MMKKLLVLTVLCVVTTACVPAAYTAAAVARHRRGLSANIAASAPDTPAGRWDNVMMLDAQAPVKVLTMDGTVTTGAFISANVSVLRIAAGGGEVVVTAADVMRVDRLAGLGSDAVGREGVKGALLGAGAVGVAGLLLGAVPPPRVFAAGGAVGAYHGATSAALAPAPGTIYLAPSTASTGAPSRPRGSRNE